MVIRMREIRERILRDMKDFWLAALVIVGYGAAVNLIFGAFCPMVILTGFPCPGCGMSRSIFYLFTGRLQQYRLFSVEPLYKREKGEGNCFSDRRICSFSGRVLYMADGFVFPAQGAVCIYGTEYSGGSLSVL